MPRRPAFLVQSLVVQEPVVVSLTPKQRDVEVFDTKKFVLGIASPTLSKVP